MTEVFADTNYWVAMTDARDTWHVRAVAASRALGPVRLVTTEPILIEFLNHFSAYGGFWRDRALLQVETILTHADVEVVPYDPTTLRRGMDLYAARQDKQYSLTDCMSMNICRAMDIEEVLTHDHHFAQEGCAVLL